MLNSQTALALVETIQASEAHAEGGVNPWLIGGSAFLILMLMLIALVAFGGGRDHS